MSKDGGADGTDTKENPFADFEGNAGKDTKANRDHDEFHV
jgi:hypothetical protein